MENYQEVLHQMQAFGIELRPKDLPLEIPTRKRRTCGVKGKAWYWLQLFRRGQCEYVVGRFGSYRHGGSDQKVEIDWAPLSDEERRRFAAERAAAEARSRELKAQEAEAAALTAAELWRKASGTGSSPYLERKGVEPEACRFMRDGSIVIPLLRYDKPRAEALRAVQRIYPGPRVDTRTGEELPQKTFTKNFAKTGCALRLGQVAEGTPLIIVCEGYATGLTLRQATSRRVPVFVALDAYNLVFVVQIVRALYPRMRIVIAADDDWRTADHAGPNPGRRMAKEVARSTPGCDLVWPVFAAATRQDKDTDFNDLQQRQGLATVERQLGAVLEAIEKGLDERRR